MRDRTSRQQARPIASHPQPVPPLAEPVPSLPEETDFLEPDGRYLSQNYVHVQATTRLLWALTVHCPQERNTVASDVLIFYDRTDRRKAVAPDVFVVLDHVMKSKKSYVVWEEGRVPGLAVETLSYTTRHRDLKYKRDLYAGMGIQEYFAFDIEPKGESPALIRFRLNPETGVSERRESRGDALYSKVLGTTLRPDGELLHLIEPTTGRPYPSPSGAQTRDERAEDRANRAERENQRLQLRVAKLLRQSSVHSR